MRHFDIAILGSGASGCMCALTSAVGGKTIALIDKNKTPAKKLMATGNGRCNLTNTNNLNASNIYNRNLSKFFDKFDCNKTRQFFEELGLVLYSDEEGRVYPISNSAKSVVDVLNNVLAKHKNISIFNEKIIEKIEKSGKIFKITLNDEVISAEKIVFSLGGDNNNLLESLGVGCKKNSPSLCALKTDKNLKTLANIRVSPVKITAKTAGGERYIEKGEVLFKEQGLSGIVVFNASTMFARKGNFSGTVTLDLFPNTSLEKLTSILSKRRELDVKVSKFFDGMFASGVAYYLFEKCEINEERSCLALKNSEIERLAKAIKNLEFNVIAPLDNNQVYSGGALLEKLDHNLQSKACPNLYICGEACDVDAICGGYNLQWAWTSGYIVGRAVK